MQPSLPPRHRSNRFCPLMPCRAGRARALDLWRAGRRLVTAGDDSSDGRRRSGQPQRPQAAVQGLPDLPEQFGEHGGRCRRLPAGQRGRTCEGGRHAISHVNCSRLWSVVTGCVSPHRCVCRQGRRRARDLPLVPFCVEPCRVCVGYTSYHYSMCPWERGRGRGGAWGPLDIASPGHRLPAGPRGGRDI